MSASETVIHLSEAAFGERERPLVEHAGLTASAFRFTTGVCGLRLRSPLGQAVLLPFQGQQIWSLEFFGRDLTMRSMFSEPQPTQEFLATFGAFYVHCGISAVGGPSAEDTHPLHGELPNAAYQEAYLLAGHDEEGPYIGLGGRYRHTRAFGPDYVANPLARLYAGSSLLRLTVQIFNLKRSPLELFYLGHANFRPVDNARLVYSALPMPKHLRVRTSVPSHIRPDPGYRDFVEALKEHPERADVLTPGLAFDPEVVFFVDYLAGPDGWAHTLQVHPDGSADYLRHRPAQLRRCTRWMCRTPDQDALGFEPGTAEPEGRLAETAKGNAQTLPPGAEFRCDLALGALSPVEAAAVERQITAIKSQSDPSDRSDPTARPS